MSTPKTCKKCGRLLTVLKEQGIGPYVAYCTNSECSEFQKHVGTQAQSIVPPSTFEADLSARGRQLHERMLDAARVHEFYRRGCLWGELTDSMVASIHVPENAWRALTAEEQQSLESYAASLVPRMKANPELHTSTPTSAPAFPAIQRKAAALSPSSWVVIAGRLRPSGGGGHDILTDQVVASGKREALGDGDHRAPRLG